MSAAHELTARFVDRSDKTILGVDDPDLSPASQNDGRQRNFLPVSVKDPPRIPMSRRSLLLDDTLQSCLLDMQSPVSPLEQQLLDETAELPGAKMQIAVEQARFMTLIVLLIGARRCLEIGTFTGYSALSIATALPADGQLITMDVDAETTAIARRYWAAAGLTDRIDARTAPALETLAALTAAGENGCFDLAFIDADKANYPRYYSACLDLIRPGGVILVDNVLWSGRIADAADQSPDTVGIRTFNRLVRDDPRVHHCVVPVADGLTIAMRRPADDTPGAAD